MSEVGQAPSSGFEAVPVRPPSPPSRAPRYIWCGLALLCLVAFGAALGIYLWSREAFSSKDLKQATSVKITYIKGKQPKSVVVNDPAELRALLDSLIITDTNPGLRQGPVTGGAVEFTLPDGTVARTAFLNQTRLDRADWGQVQVEADFHRKVNEIATRAEGRPIDVLRVDN